MERVKTGIPGFDELIEGGLPKGFNILIVGRPGTGKTIFGLQYLYTGALSGENGLYISLDCKANDIKVQASQFGWDLEELERQNKLHVLEVPLNKEKHVDIFKLIEDSVKEWRISRIVFDSLSSFIFNLNQFTLHFPIMDDLSKIPEGYKKYLGENPLYKQMIPEKMLQEKPDPSTYAVGSIKQRMVYLMMKELALLGTTNIIITSSSSSDFESAVDGVSEYVCDGSVVMNIQKIAKKTIRSIRIQKMRGTKHELDSYIIEFLHGGIVLSEEKVFEGSKISGVNP